MSENVSREVLRDPYSRVLSTCMVDPGHRYYDRKKYAELVRRAVWNLLQPCIGDEEKISGSRHSGTSLDRYL